MLEWIDCAQNSPEWLEARLGVPSASQFGAILSNGRGGAPSKTRRTYMLKLLGERLTREPSENFRNAATDRGHDMEPQARALYAFETGEEPTLCGFARHSGLVEGIVGASPDSLVGDAGVNEIKTKAPHLQLDVLMRDEMPAEHYPQVQGQLWVCEREWCDFVSYWPGLPLFVKRIYRDEAYIQKVLAPGVNAFCADLDALERRFAA